MALPTGRIALLGKNLVIACAPQIAGKLVRFFAGARRGHNGEVIIGATDGNIRELDVLRQLYPLEPDREAADRMALGLERYAARERSIDAMRVDSYTPPTFKMALPPREYQAYAADLLHRSGGLLVGDDVGLGKTIVGIASMVGDGMLPAVVVTKTDVVDQWERQIRRFAPELRTHVVTKAKAYPLADKALTEVGPTGRRRIIRNGARRMPDVLILSYSKLDGWRDALVGINPGLVVWDECQELRTGQKSEKGVAAKAISDAAGARLGLSATPIFNYGHEIFNVLECIAPGVLGSEPEFRSEWCAGDQIRHPAVLRAHLVERGVFLRRRRRDVRRELPPIDRIWHPVASDTRRLRALTADVAELARKVLALDGHQLRGEAFRAAGDLDWRLRQATGLAKVPGVLDLLRLVLDDPKEKVLLYAHHHLVFDALLDGLGGFGIKAVEFTGRCSAPAKRVAFSSFVDGDARVMVMATRAGAGLDGLQAVCSSVVVAELDWSPGPHIQGEGRVARDGQQNPVAVYYAVSSEGSDPVIMDVLGLKESQRHGIVDGDMGGDSDIIEGSDSGRMKKLAAAYLEKYEMRP